MIENIIFTCLLSLSANTFSANNDSTKINQLPEFVVTESAAEKNVNSTQMGSYTISDKQILSMPVMFGEPDIVKTLQALPGVSQGVEGFTGMYVRGGDNDQNLFLFQGLPLYHVSHLGGIFSSFNVATIDKIDFFKAAFPAQYGGRISSITDITMKQPNFEKFTGRFSLGLLSGNAHISGPIWKYKTAFSASLRRSWIDIFSIPALAVFNATQKKKGKKTIFHYAFTDFNARIDHKFNDRASAYILGYYGHDNLKMGERRFLPKKQSYKKEDDYFNEDSNKLSWGNWGILGDFNYCFDNAILSASLYYTDYSSHYEQEYEYQRNMQEPESYGYNRTTTKNSIGDLGLTTDYSGKFGSIYSLDAGIGFIHHNYLPEGIEHTSLEDAEESYQYNGSPHISGNELFAYVNNSFNFADWIAINAGLRAVTYRIQSHSHNSLEPRAAVRFKFLTNFSFKAAYSRMSQFAQQVSRNYINLPTDLWQPISAQFKPLISDQYSIGFYGNLPCNIYFSIEGWYKDMKNVLEYKEGISTIDPSTSWEDKLTSGKGWSYGLDFNISRSEGKLTGSIGYGLMWNWRKFEQLNKGEKFPAKFDNRHKFNINLNYKLNDKIEFNAGWTYMTGNRMTLSLYEYDGLNSYPDAPNSSFDNYKQYFSNRNNIRMPAYHRLDLSVNIYNRMNNGRMGIWSFGLYNAYCNMNAMTIVKNNEVIWDDNGNNMIENYKCFKTFKMIPIVPSVSYTYIF